MVYTYEHGKNKSGHHAFSSEKHTMQNVARCRDMLQHPWLCDSCTANASLCNIIFCFCIDSNVIALTSTKEYSEENLEYFRLRSSPKAYFLF